MPINCGNGNITIPTLETDPCGGKTTSNKCIIDSNIYSELGLSANSTQEEFNIAIYTAFLQQKALIEDLQTQIDNLP